MKAGFNDWNWVTCISRSEHVPVDIAFGEQIHRTSRLFEEHPEHDRYRGEKKHDEHPVALYRRQPQQCEADDADDGHRGGDYQ